MLLLFGSLRLLDLLLHPLMLHLLADPGERLACRAGAAADRRGGAALHQREVCPPQVDAPAVERTEHRAFHGNGPIKVCINDDLIFAAPWVYILPPITQTRAPVRIVFNGNKLDSARIDYCCVAQARAVACG